MITIRDKRAPHPGVRVREITGLAEVATSGAFSSLVGAPPSSPGGGVTDHGALTGRGDDDHAQYHNDDRGDARYSLLGHGHSYEAAGAVAAHAGASDPHSQYLTVAEANALYSAIGGAAPLSVMATITVPAGRAEHIETVAFTGCTALKRLMVSLAAHADTDENDAELLDVAGMSATPGADAATITVAFREPTSGPVKFNLMAV